MNKLIFVFLFVLLVFSVSAKRRIYLTRYRTDVYLDESEIVKLQLPGEKIDFVDITDTPDFYTQHHLSPAEFPSQLVKQDVVKPLVEQAVRESPQQLQSVVTTLSTRFAQRTCDTQTGLDSVNWVLEQVKTIQQKSPKASKISYELVPTRSYKQPSLIVRIKGESNKVVIVGGHIDSVRNPGADDNGSGSAAVLELFRILAFSNWENVKTLEFHFYGCEESGLIGSGIVASDYKSKGVNVHAMLNLDMICYFSRKQTALITSSSSSSLNLFTELVMKGYGTLPFEKKGFFGGSSDHASWNRNGFHACWPWENPYNSHIHGSGDTVDKCDFVNAVEFIRFGLGFMVELGYNA